jgi:nitrite reductase (NADH) large subunit
LGLDLNRAIAVDKFMRTSQTDIYACGDCAEYRGHTAGLWTVSMAQGMIAGKNAAGLETAYVPEAPPYTMKAMGSSIWSAGVQTENSLVNKDSVSGQLIKLFFDGGNILVGSILIGDISQALNLKKALAEGIAKREAKSRFLKES